VSSCTHHWLGKAQQAVEMRGKAQTRRRRRGQGRLHWRRRRRVVLCDTRLQYERPPTIRPPRAARISAHTSVPTAPPTGPPAWQGMPWQHRRPGPARDDHCHIHGGRYMYRIRMQNELEKEKYLFNGERSW
jgi:hypothetical protein